MAARYIAAAREIQPEGPYLLGGWSMGAIVAYEMAQQLTRQREPVGLLVVLDHRPPDPSGDGEFLDDIRLLARIFGDAFPVDQEMLGRLDEDQRGQYCLQQAAKLNLIPPEVGPAQVRNYLKLYGANLKALRDYVARKYPGRITLLKTGYEVADGDETIGWGALAEQGVEVYEVPGSHHDMVAPPHVEALARHLNACLARVNGREREILPTSA